MNEKTRKTLHSSERRDWGTPRELFDEWNQRWGPFTLDPATTRENPLDTQHYYTPEENGLHQDWSGRVFCNPPYGRSVGDWVLKAHDEVLAGNAQIVVMLLPSRTGTKWFHQLILPYHEIIFLPGRIRFVGATNPAPFNSMLVIMR